MDRNCTDTCYGTRPLKYEKTKCFSECPDNYFMHKNECLTADSCRGYGLGLTFKKTCYSECPSGTFPNYVNGTCIAYQPSKIWNAVLFFLIIAICFFFIFYIMCCFKGFKCTSLKSCVSRTLQ